MKTALLGLLIVIGLCSGCASLTKSEPKAGYYNLHINATLADATDLTNFADVSINGILVGTTDGAGNLNVPLENKKYDVEVAATGYKTYREEILLLHTETNLKMKLMRDSKCGMK